MAVRASIIFIVGLLAAIPLASEGANVLGVFTSQSPSHLIIHMSYVKALVERGHNVTVLTTVAVKEKDLRFNHIYIPPSEEAQKGIDEVKSNLITRGGPLAFMKNLPAFFTTFGRASRDAIKDPRVQDLIHNPDNKFDLMILGYFMNDYELGIATHMKCPIIISWVAASNTLVERYIGNPPEISYVPASPFASPDLLTFKGRLTNFLLYHVTRAFFILLDWEIGKTYKELFPAPEYPPLAELGKRVSLVFANSHFTEGVVRPNVPALVDVGGIQIKDKPDPLPENLRGIVEAASEHGVIYVSFGSNLDSKYIDSDFTENIFAVLSSLKQTVLWKWDGEDTPGNAPNIHFEKWLPQDDLLAHPNMRLFITHAGKGSVAEAQYHGVPMVAIPMFGDQPSNGQKMADDGFGVKVDHSSMTADSLRAAVMDVLETPKYRETVKRFSALYRDRPMTARETAAYWMEYVIRHKGAYHMQSPLVHLNELQYVSLDVVAFLLLSLYVAFKILKFALKSACKLICGRLCSKKQKVKRQ